jgi:hypothetical protein
MRYATLHMGAACNTQARHRNKSAFARVIILKMIIIPRRESYSRNAGSGKRQIPYEP